ncbi:hypothetical protein Poli38472_004857 [Pythium oligandrum]|uniref:Uncharacterized protein n=1 Tax=Pythium oligandrum TaxID=41045 RepID=A0A8K1FII5_PYTOL|nr:hypothetical protein Poli38472_004857 [Pythium oligandrum]|eukprot:TMW59788.1 hypothetical protein Poli38472_004857 [Pythium oligandrum]
MVDASPHAKLALYQTLGSKKRQPDRQTQELRSLRKEAEELETRLCRLHASDKRRLSRECNELVSPVNQLLVSMWQKVAERQREDRERVEEENAQLRKMVEVQNRAISRFEQLIEKQRHCEDLVVPFRFQVNPNEHHKTRNEPISLDLSVIHKELVPALVTMGAEVNFLMANPRFRLNSPFRDIYVISDREAQQSGIEQVETMIYPYDFRSTAEVIWSEFKETTVPCDQEADEMSSRDSVDLMVRKMGCHAEVGQKESASLGNIAVRRFVEHQRVVIVWQVLAKVDVRSRVQRHGDGFRTRHRGWSVIEPHQLPGQNSFDSAMGSRMRSYELTNIEIPEDSDEERVMELVTTFVLESIRLKKDERQEDLENRLLERHSTFQRHG